MKSVLIHLDDEDYNLLEEIKGNKTWRDLLLINIKSKGDTE